MERAASCASLKIVAPLIFVLYRVDQHGLSYEGLKEPTAKAIRRYSPNKPFKEGLVILGQGNYGKVRLARDVETQEIVAVKKFKNDIAIPLANEELALINVVQGRVDRENPSARSTLSRVLGHAHAHKSYVFMPLLNRGDGQKVKADLRALRSDPNTYQEANTRFLHIAKGYAEAVKNLHALGLVHRDIKPENFVHTANAEGVEQTTLIDFGLTGDQRNPAMPYLFGTSTYMPPEVQNINGPENKDQYDATQMDSYSLGMVLLELLKGWALYEAPLSLSLKDTNGVSTEFALKKHMKSFEPDVSAQKKGYSGPCSPGVPSELLQNLAPYHVENLIAQLLAADPKDRMTATQAFEVLTHWTEPQSKPTDSLASTSKTPRKTVTWIDLKGGTFMSKNRSPDRIQPEVSQPATVEQPPVAAKRKSTLYRSFFVQRKPVPHTSNQPVVSQPTNAPQATEPAPAVAKRSRSLYQSFFAHRKHR